MPSHAKLRPKYLVDLYTEVQSVGPKAGWVGTVGFGLTQLPDPRTKACWANLEQSG